MTLHERMVLTDKALGRETGFEDGDLLAPGSDEWKRRVLTQIAAGPLPDLALAAIKALGLNITPESATAMPAPGAGDVGPLGPAPAPAAVPAIEAPRTPPAPGGDAVAAAATYAAGVEQSMIEEVMAAHGPGASRRDGVLAASDLLVTRAMERAHARLFGRGKGRPRPITDATKLANALHDAWGQVPQTARLVGVDPAVLTDTCDRYCRELLARGMDHNQDLLAAVVDKAVLGV